MIYLFSSITWRDSIEIFIISCALYYFSLWLKKDHQKNLLIYMYAYCMLIGASYFFNLSLIHELVIVFTPGFLMILILIHQKTLQKNFIALKNIAPIQTPKNIYWFDDLTRACLAALNNKKEVFLIIEREKSLTEFVHADIKIDAPITKEILDIIFETSQRDPYLYVWITMHGHLRGINAQWNAALIEPEWPFEYTPGDIIDPTTGWFTSNTDALVLYLSATHKDSPFVIHDKIVRNVTAPNALHIAREHIHGIKKGETPYAYQHKKHSYQQPNS